MSLNEEIANIARQLSRRELFRLNAYLEHHGVQTTIIGGWAVFSYNPYFESIDVDIVAPHQKIPHVMVIITDQCQWELTTIQIADETFTRFFKPIAGQDENIYLDLFSTNFKNVFHENSGKILTFDLCLQNGHYVRRSIYDTNVNVPTKELLFLYKLKSFRDRVFDIPKKIDPKEKARLEAKAKKDLSDIIALMDPNYGPLDLKSLRGLVVDNSLQFLAATIEDLPSQTEAIQRYRGTSKREVQNWVEKILGAFR